jgi:hypothetical protein
MLMLRNQKPHSEITKDPGFNGMADYVGIPQQFALPKAFQTQIFDLRLSFLTLIPSIKQACFAVSH